MKAAAAPFTTPFTAPFTAAPCDADDKGKKQAKDRKRDHRTQNKRNTRALARRCRDCMQRGFPEDSSARSAARRGTASGGARRNHDAIQF